MYLKLQAYQGKTHYQEVKCRNYSTQRTVGFFFVFFWFPFFSDDPLPGLELRIKLRSSDVFRSCVENKRLGERVNRFTLGA